ncbi:MAG: TetR/AcrR family transcriptional regulator C-terminal domain-containing protein [Faecalibacterium sp.]|nr:TetR/AcrR family transcriptional regulator C-terminal domain-containing protein [Faecalibacterium sp.]
MSQTCSDAPKIDRRVVKTKQALFDALLRLLRTQNVEEVSVSRLCEVANVNRSSFYKYYNTPADILREREAELSNLLYARWTTFRPGGLKEALLHQLLELQQQKDLFRLMLGPHGLPGFMTHLADGAKAAGARRFMELNPSITIVQAEYLFLFWLKAGQGMIEQWILDGCVQPPELIAELIANAALLGMQGYGMKDI